MEIPVMKKETRKHLNSKFLILINMINKEDQIMNVFYKANIKIEIIIITTILRYKN